MSHRQLCGLCLWCSQWSGTHRCACVLSPGEKDWFHFVFLHSLPSGLAHDSCSDSTTTSVGERIASPKLDLYRCQMFSINLMAKYVVSPTQQVPVIICLCFSDATVKILWSFLHFTLKRKHCMLSSTTGKRSAKRQTSFSPHQKCCVVCNGHRSPGVLLFEF